MDPFTAFGLLAVTLMLVFDAIEDRGPHYVIGFAIRPRSRLGLRLPPGAWPFGVVGAIWASVALRRWWLKARA